MCFWLTTVSLFWLTLWLDVLFLCGEVWHFLSEFVAQDLSEKSEESHEAMGLTGWITAMAGAQHGSNSFCSLDWTNKIFVHLCHVWIAVVLWWNMNINAAAVSHWRNGCIELLFCSDMEAAPSVSPSQPARHSLNLTDFHLHVPQVAWYRNSSSNSMHIQGLEPTEAHYMIPVLEPFWATESSFPSPFKWELAEFLLRKHVCPLKRNGSRWLFQSTFCMLRYSMYSVLQ